jgi:hypothetical protein
MNSENAERPRNIIVKATCRKYGLRIVIPCNWNVQGRCGADTKYCEIVNMVASGVGNG